MASSAHHFLLLLADSALPLGSFAFSSGLESYLAHTRPSSSFSKFLPLSLTSYASTTLPFVIAAYRTPQDLIELNDSLDATTMCTVGRRASIAQGRALLSIWERSFNPALSYEIPVTTAKALVAFSTNIRPAPSLWRGESEPHLTVPHLGPLFGTISSILGLSVQQAAYVFMLSHVKALLSAAVRASVFGPYQAQKLLASREIQDGIQQAIREGWDTRTEDTAQTIPVMDLWIGRHEILYSRIFNS
jgi:urease accessory protein